MSPPVAGGGTPPTDGGPVGWGAARASLRAVARRADRALARTPVALQGRRLVRRTEWSIGIARGPSPTELTSLRPGSNPVLTRRDVSDVRAAFVADPFLWRVDGRWWMFFEVLDVRTDRGVIGAACSDDALRWDYQGVVLQAPWHLSYPFVFAHDGALWMVPESESQGRVDLYRATAFPRDWRREATLLEGAPYGDATLWQADERWSLLAAAGGSATLRCFQAPDLLGPWTEHPGSPLVDGDSRIARPGGRVVEVAPGRWVRFAQDATVRYGGGLQAFAFDSPLGADGPRGRPLGSVTLDGGAPASWNRLGMHTIDAHRGGDGWLAALDGRGLPPRR